MLYLVATPIGNLEDITLRSLRILKESDYILAEDTRLSKRLLSHYQIDTPLKSYHKFNEASFLEKIIDDLKKGKAISLISDAGTPCISDPGERLVRKCIQEGIPISPIPGACSVIAALSVSGKTSDAWQFIGFLPRKKGALEKALKNALSYPGTTAALESCHRIQKSLSCLADIAPNCHVLVAREMTKKFEEFLRGTAKELSEIALKRTLKGEMLIIIENFL